MPCYYTGSAEGDARLFAEESEERMRKKYAKELIKLTAMLCKMCKKSEDNNLILPKQIEKWWEKHKKTDKGQKNV